MAVIRPSFTQILYERFRVRPLGSNELLLKPDAPWEASELLPVPSSRFEFLSSLEKLAQGNDSSKVASNRHRKTIDCPPSRFQCLRKRVGPVENIDRSGREDINVINLAQQRRIVPGERLRSADNAFMATLNDDCDLVHINPARVSAPTKPSAMRSLRKTSSYLRRPIDPNSALSNSSRLR